MGATLSRQTSALTVCKTSGLFSPPVTPSTEAQARPPGNGVSVLHAGSSRETNLLKGAPSRGCAHADNHALGGQLDQVPKGDA